MAKILIAELDFDPASGCLHCLIMRVMQVRKETVDAILSEGGTPPRAASTTSSIRQLVKATTEVAAILRRDGVGREKHIELMVDAFRAAMERAHDKVDEYDRQDAAEAAAPDLVGKPTLGSA